jgi:DNA-binding PadR family transcriptional regulator
MLENINSGEDYANIIINSLMEAEQDLSDDEKTESGFLKHQFITISELADQTYSNYIIGKRESYMFTEEEFISTVHKAKENYIQELLNSMVDKDLLEVSVGEDGDLLYGLSDKGNEEANQLFSNNN